MEQEVLGVAIGGTTINVGLVQNNIIKKEATVLVDKEATAEVTLQSLFQIIRQNLTIEVSKTKGSAILGAASLCLQKTNNNILQ